MATKKPRLTITLEPALSDSLRRLSELTGNSQSSLISEMLSGSGPIFEKMIRVLEAAEVAKGAIKGRVTRGLDDAQTKFEKALGLSLVGFDELEAVLFCGRSHRRKGRRRRQARARRRLSFRRLPTPI